MMTRRKSAWFLILGLSVLVWIGCQSGPKKEAQEAAPAQETSPTPAMTSNENQSSGMSQEQAEQKQPEPTQKIETPPVKVPEPARKEPKAQAPPPAPAELNVKAGSVIKAKLDQDLSSHESKANDAFTLKVLEPVVVAGYTAIPAGAVVNGVVVSAKPSGKASGRGDITLAFKSVTIDGKTYDLEAETYYGQAEGSGDKDAAIIAGGAGAGAIIGGIVGGKKGALLGGLIGGAAGTGTVLATSGPQVKITAGSDFGVTLTGALLLPAGPKVEG